MASALANRYARALVDVITKPGAAVTPEKTTAELESFVSTFQASPELRNVLISPAVAPQKKRAIIAGLGERLGLSRTTQNFLYVITNHRRLGLLDQILAAIERLLDERLGVVRAEVASAQPVEPEQQSAVAAGLGKVTGKQVRARFSVDPSLLGGVVARIGSTIYDGSVRGRLQALERRLIAEDRGS